MYVFFYYIINIVCWSGVVYCWFLLAEMTLNKIFYPKKLLWCIEKNMLIRRPTP